MIPERLLTPLLDRVGVVLNRNLEQSTPGRVLRGQLAGRSFAIRVEGFALRVRLSVDDDRLGLAASDEAADAEVAGAPLSLLSMLRDAESPAGRTRVTISGDPELAQSFQKLLGFARPEIEAEVARVIGEAPAALASRAVHSALGFLRRVRTTATHSAAEYLTEESRDLPAKAEADLHLSQVDRIREDVDRTAARIALLEERVRARKT